MSSRPGPRQHYLPASFLARFSNDRELDPRRRRLFVADRQQAKVFTVAAENAGFVRNLYGDTVDAIWSAYEERLPQALKALTTPGKEISGEVWLRVLVPFIAALLLRGPDFEERFKHRFGAMAAHISDTNAREVRTFELNRLLAPVLAARWVVLHATGESPLIIADVGWGPYRDSATGELGAAIPLDTRTVLGLVPMRTRSILRWNGSDWSAIIEHHQLQAGNHASLCAVMASAAYRQIFGPTRESVSQVHEVLRGQASPIPAEPFPFAPLGGAQAIPNQPTWFQLISAIKKAPGDPFLEGFNCDLADLKNGWSPPIVVPFNFQHFPPALRLKGDVIDVALYAVLKSSPGEWELAQDMPLTYPPAPPESEYAALHARLSRGLER